MKRFNSLTLNDVYTDLGDPINQLYRRCIDTEKQRRDISLQERLKLLEKAGYISPEIRYEIKKLYGKNRGSNYDQDDYYRGIIKIEKKLEKYITQKRRC